MLVGLFSFKRKISDFAVRIEKIKLLILSKNMIYLNS
nr:MAG TPA: hypothetical protein [Caudoviricetes sp.]